MFSGNNSKSWAGLRGEGFLFSLPFGLRVEPGGELYHRSLSAKLLVCRFAISLHRYILKDIITSGKENFKIKLSSFNIQIMNMRILLGGRGDAHWSDIKVPKIGQIPQEMIAKAAPQSHPTGNSSGPRVFFVFWEVGATRKLLFFVQFHCFCSSVFASIFNQKFQFQLARAGAGTTRRTGRLGGPQPWPIEIWNF